MLEELGFERTAHPRKWRKALDEYTFLICEYKPVTGEYVFKLDIKMGVTFCPSPVIKKHINECLDYSRQRFHEMINEMNMEI